MKPNPNTKCYHGVLKTMYCSKCAVQGIKQGE